MALLQHAELSVPSESLLLVCLRAVEISEGHCQPEHVRPHCAFAASCAGAKDMTQS